MGEVNIFLNDFSPDMGYNFSFDIFDGGDSNLIKQMRKGKRLGTLELDFSFTFTAERQVGKLLVFSLTH